jgi:hypothetical protein
VRKLLSLPITLLAVLAACSDTPTGSAPDSVPAEQATLQDAVVFTLGAPSPVSGIAPKGPSFSDATSSVDVGGSTTSAVTLKTSTCSGSSQSVTLSYSITGRQAAGATFNVNTKWTFNGTSWTGSEPVQVSVPARAPGDAATVRLVSLTVENGSSKSSGSSAFGVAPFNLATSSPAALDVDDADLTINVVFAECPTTTPPNTNPVIVVPTSDFVVEATSSSGAVANYSALVTASDAEDGDITADVQCTPASNTTFALGSTIVNCSVTDSKGASATGSFTVRVVDTTPAAFTNFPTSLVTLVATDIDGAALNISALGITVADWNNVSEPSSFSCEYVPGTKLGIGTTTSITCKARDAIANEMIVGQSFDVFVGLNINASGFLTPLRMVAPYSGHKLGSTIPHKFLAPTYADGTPATDLATGITLAIRKLDPTPDVASTDVNDFTAGSTAWRYDDLAGQYIFNAKTGTTSPWAVGTWETVASYKGITLAKTRLEIRR